MQALVAGDLAEVEKILIDRAASPVAVIPDLSGYIVSAGGKRLLTVDGLWWRGAAGDSAWSHF